MGWQWACLQSQSHFPSRVTLVLVKQERIQTSVLRFGRLSGGLGSNPQPVCTRLLSYGLHAPLTFLLKVACNQLLCLSVLPQYWPHTSRFTSLVLVPILRKSGYTHDFVTLEVVLTV